MSEQRHIERRECGHPADDGSGRICRRICKPGRDYHGGGHWFADPDLDGESVRHSTARWIVTGEQPGRAETPDAIARRIVERIRHCADVIDADDVSRTARTLNRMALIIEGEFLASSGVFEETEGR